MASIYNGLLLQMRSAHTHNWLLSTASAAATA